MAIGTIAVSGLEVGGGAAHRSRHRHHPSSRLTDGTRVASARQSSWLGFMRSAQTRTGACSD
jgi:hypothetical protein